MKKENVMVLIALTLALAGCDAETKATVTYSKDKSVASAALDDGDAEHLAATHPSLKKACALVGSCKFLYVHCYKFDGEAVWIISVPGAESGDDLWMVSSYAHTVDDSVADFVDNVRRVRAENDYKRQHPEKAHTIEKCCTTAREKGESQ